MDISKEIENQIVSIKKSDNPNCLDSILSHIERAEYYYSQGKEDSCFFNDVVYRSNQAYEGALKEAYRILAHKTDEEVSEMSPNNIEKFFERNKIFKYRVLQLFKNYRQEWRNKSTHDYKLVFDESEAFIALTSVSGFVHLLLKQIQEKIAYLTQQKKQQEKEEVLKNVVIKAQSHNYSPIEKLIEIIKQFSIQNEDDTSNDKGFLEVELVGRFHAFIDSIPNVTAEREPVLNYPQRMMRPDFIVNIENESIILEFKNSVSGAIKKGSIEQVLSYLQAYNLKYGIVYFANHNNASSIKVTEEIRILNNKEYNITVISA